MRRLIGSAKPTLSQLERKEIAKASAKAFASKGADSEAQSRYLAYLADPACDQERRDRILSVLAWSDTVFLRYAQVKSAIYSGDESAVFDVRDLCECPWEWDDIIGVEFPASSSLPETL